MFATVVNDRNDLLLDMFLNRLSTEVTLSQIARDEKARSLLRLDHFLRTLRIFLFLWQVYDGDISAFSGHENCD